MAWLIDKFVRLAICSTFSSVVPLSAVLQSGNKRIRTAANPPRNSFPQIRNKLRKMAGRNNCQGCQGWLQLYQTGEVHSSHHNFCQLLEFASFLVKMSCSTRISKSHARWLWGRPPDPDRFFIFIYHSWKFCIRLMSRVTEAQSLCKVLKASVTKPKQQFSPFLNFTFVKFYLNTDSLYRFIALAQIGISEAILANKIYGHLDLWGSLEGIEILFRYFRAAGKIRHFVIFLCSIYKV